MYGLTGSNGVGFSPRWFCASTVLITVANAWPVQELPSCRITYALPSCR
jgi:hypothetical protein